MGLFKLFAGAYGKAEGGGTQAIVGQLLNKLKFWIIVTIIFFIIYWILVLFQCSKPKGGNGMCIMSENKGEAMTFKYDISNLSSGGECGDNDPYQIMGQQVDWIDTGYVTNGKQLIVYADGNYFPWHNRKRARCRNQRKHSLYPLQPP